MSSLTDWGVGGCQDVQTQERSAILALTRNKLGGSAKWLGRQTSVFGVLSMRRSRVGASIQCVYKD